MVKCPRCENMVDETQRTTCPVCFTPLQASANTTLPPNSPSAPMPPAQAPPPLMPNSVTPPPGATFTPFSPQAAPPPPGMGAPPTSRPNVRVSLTGEVIHDEVAPPSNEPVKPGGYAGANIPQRPNPIPPLRTGPGGPRVTTASRRESSSSGSGAAVGIIAVFAIVVLLGLAGFGGWWFLSHRSNPKDQATKFLAALKNLDWNGIYETAEIDKQICPTEKDFEDKMKSRMEQVPGGEGAIKNMLASFTYSLGEPTISGETATVPMTASLANKTDAAPETLSLKRIDGVWKVSKDDPTMRGIDLVLSGGLGGGGGFGGGGGLGR